MYIRREVFVLFVVLTTYSRLLYAYLYNMVGENEEVISECPNQPDNVLNIFGIVDLSEMKFEMGLNDITMSGNLTFVWDVKQTDRIQVTLELFKYNRGVWEPTVYAINVPSFCPIMFDKHQYWHKAWLSHLKNNDQVKDKCVNTPGTKFIHEPFTVSTNFEAFSNIEGRVKVVVKALAYDALNRRHRTSICFEIIGECIRV